MPPWGAHHGFGALRPPAGPRLDLERAADLEAVERDVAARPVEHDAVRGERRAAVERRADRADLVHERLRRRKVPAVRNRKPRAVLMVNDAIVASRYASPEYIDLPAVICCQQITPYSQN